MEKRTEILRESYRLFSESDYEKVSLSDIAKHAGINKSLLQSYYPQKQKIIADLLSGMLEESYRYMDAEAGETDSYMWRISDYATLFFLSARKNLRLSRFVRTTASHTELMDLWVDITLQWLWDGMQRTGAYPDLTYLRVRTALSFTMYGSLKLVRDQDELNLSTEEIFENHVRLLLVYFGEEKESVEEVIQHTRSRAAAFDTGAFLDYCQKNIAWFIL